MENNIEKKKNGVMVLVIILIIIILGLVGFIVYKELSSGTNNNNNNSNNYNYSYNIKNHFFLLIHLNMGCIFIHPIFIL